MKLRSVIIVIAVLITASTFGQDIKLNVSDIKQNSLKFTCENVESNHVRLQYGLTRDLEMGYIEGLLLTNLKDATFYYVKAIINDKNIETEIQLFSTASKSSGDITVYFNQWVNNNASSITDAISISAFEDTIIAYIDRVENTLDFCNYNTGSEPIVTAVNNAEARGVVVRYIAADNTGTNNYQLDELSATIPMIQRPDDGEIMHNKFIIKDAANPALAQVLTGSTNHTDNSCHEDYNNIVIVEDQALALAYEIEFEEMWGSTSNTPNASNAKFGDAKTDNTPHSFNIGGIAVESYFSPSDGTTEKIEAAVLSANTDMQFALLTYTNNDLGDAVISIHNSGVDVKGIIENDFYFGSEFSGLESAGVDVYSHSSTAHYLHHKYCIVDANNTGSDPLVVTGSHNWTNSAEDDYDENTLIIHDAIISNMYYEEFMARYADMTGTGIVETTPRSVNISPNPANSQLIIQTESLFISDFYKHSNYPYNSQN